MVWTNNLAFRRWFVDPELEYFWKNPGTISYGDSSENYELGLCIVYILK